VARSNIYGLTRMGAKVSVGGPITMMPRYVERLGVEVHYKLEDAIRDADIIMMLRISSSARRRTFSPRCGSSQVLLPEPQKHRRGQGRRPHHAPGPMNRGVEISPEIADGPTRSFSNRSPTGWPCGWPALSLVGR